MTATLPDTFIARVTNVSDRDGLILVQVQLPYSDDTKTVPLLRWAGGLQQLPEEGQLVLLVESHYRGYICLGIISSSIENPPPDPAEGDTTLRYGPDTEIRISKDSNGNYDAVVEASGNVRIEGGGGVTIKSSGTVEVDASSVVLAGASGEGAEVARNGDPVEVTDENGNTLTGQITDGSSNVDAT